MQCAGQAEVLGLNRTFTFSLDAERSFVVPAVHTNGFKYLVMHATPPYNSALQSRRRSPSNYLAWLSAVAEVVNVSNSSFAIHHLVYADKTWPQRVGLANANSAGRLVALLTINIDSIYLSTHNKRDFLIKSLTILTKLKDCSRSHAGNRMYSSGNSARYRHGS